MNHRKLQLNADVGEGTGCEELMMPYLSYCSIACGGHTGTKESIFEAMEVAKRYQVKIGAHPSYPDPINFGRKIQKISRVALHKSIVSQLETIHEVAKQVDAEIYHVKAHGALYHQIIKDKDTRDAYFSAINYVLGDVKIMLPLHIKSSKIGIDESIVLYEAFGDRRYNKDLQLVPRSETNSILYSAEEIANQISNLSLKRLVVSTEMEVHDNLRFDTICLHGDHSELSSYFPKMVSILQSKNLLD